MNRDEPPVVPPVMHTPRQLNVDITSRCNLRCTYCYFFDRDELTYRDMPTEEWLQFFAEAGRNQVMNVCLAGGEPFARPDLQTLLRGIADNRMRFSILSNGGLIDDGIAAFLASTGRCNYVQISFDGSGPATHDLCRGEGSFDAAVRGVRFLQQHRVPVACRLTIHRHNVHDLEATAEFLLVELGLPSFSTNAASHLGSSCRQGKEVLLTIEDQQRAMETLVDIAQRYSGRVTATAGPLANARMWSEMERARRAGLESLPGCGVLSGCGCHWQELAVRSDGVMIPCTLLPHLELGQINRDPIHEIWQSHPILAQMRSRNSIPLTRFEECRDCDYQRYCTGNCAALAWTLTGDPHRPSPDACLRRFLAAGGTIPAASGAT